jgi:hypothetical protein
MLQFAYGFFLVIRKVKLEKLQNFET